MKPWFTTLDWWHQNHESSITAEELYNLHLTKFNPVATAYAKQLMAQTYELINTTEVNPEVITELIHEMFTQEQAATFAEELIKISEGRSKHTIASLSKTMAEAATDLSTTDKFAPLIIGADQMLETSAAAGRWKFHLPVLQEMVGGIGDGVFGLVAARPNGGKSLTMISSAFHPEGWAAQGAKLVYFGNEERIERTKHRAICCYTGMSFQWTKENPNKFRDAVAEFDEVFKDKVVFLHQTGMPYTDVENVLKEHAPDILIADQLDKFHVPGDGAAHEKMRVLYTTMREHTVNYTTSIMGVCQAGEGAAGRKHFGFEHLEHSRTGKAAELDLCICIGAENLTEDNCVRYGYLAKNKLTGIESTFSFMIEKETSRMRA